MQATADCCVFVKLICKSQETVCVYVCRCLKELCEDVQFLFHFKAYRGKQNIEAVNRTASVASKTVRSPAETKVFTLGECVFVVVVVCFTLLVIVQ